MWELGRKSPSMAAARILILVLMISAVCAAPMKKGSLHPTVTNFVISACNTAINPQSCISTISGLSEGNHSVPSDLIIVALNASINLAEKTSVTAMSLFGAVTAGLERTALEDCIQLLDDTVEEVTEAVSYVLDLDTNITAFADDDDIRTYLSAARTSQETCNEGLSLTKGIVKSQLQSNIEKISNLISTSLAMVNRLSKLSPSTNDYKTNSRTPNSHNRRLMYDDGFPAWVSAADRKLLEASREDLQMDAVVAKDGTGDFTTITAAINAVPKRHRRYVIRVKAGVYYENISIDNKKKNITLIGDGMDSTIVTGNLSVMAGVTTFHSATFAVEGKGFIARDMGFENTAGPQNHQAVALRVGAEKSVIYRCSMKGFQDTLYAHKLRQFYRDCNIYGTVDFIFGNAIAVFQGCLIFPRKPLQGQTIIITAQGREEQNENTGFSIHDCNFTSSPEFDPVKESVPTYLGRPWRQYSRTVVMESYLGEMINPRGWEALNASNLGLDTLYYGEYMNYGPGADVAGRVNWTGYHNMNYKQAKRFTVFKFIKGEKWLPWIGIPYISGLKM